mmetsp:Transcript_92117/g.159940  ORF Transcript_92117/g.159940 Transcript_92117/m.159940 type:complete len:213 (-) Transcript_92117:1498-2136(-)
MRRVVVQNVLHHFILQEQTARNYKMWRAVRSMHDIDASREFMEECQSLLHHRLHSVALLKIVTYFVDEQAKDCVFILKAKHCRQAFTDLLLDDLLRVLADIHLPELLQKVQVSQLEALRSAALVISEVHKPEDTACKFPIDDMRRSTISVSTIGLCSGMTPNQSAHHVHDPGHLLLEDGLWYAARLAKTRNIFKSFHYVLCSVLVAASAKIR